MKNVIELTILCATLIMGILACVSQNLFILIIAISIMAIIAISIMAIPIIYRIMMIELRYYYANRDLDIQQRHVEIDRARARIQIDTIKETITKLDTGQIALTPHHLHQITNNIQPNSQDNSSIDGIKNHSIWFEKAVNALHLIVIGESDSGKSTLVRAIAHARRTSGQQVLIVDPHGRPQDWLNLKIVGAGRDYPATDRDWETR